MRLKDILGIQVVNCQTRRSIRTYFAHMEAGTRDGTVALYLIRSGALFLDVKGKRVTGQKDDILLWNIEAGYASGRAGANPLTGTMITFRPLNAKGEPVRLLSRVHHPVLKIRGDAFCRRVIRQIDEAFRAAHPTRQLRCSALLSDLLLHAAHMRRSKTFQQVSEGITNRRILNVLAYIEDRYKNRLSLSELAKQAWMHPVAFARLFKQQTGITPHRYVLERKISKARDFLDDFDEGLVHTGEQLGFSNYDHFQRTFRKFTGLTPREYQRKKS